MATNLAIFFITLPIYIPNSFPFYRNFPYQWNSKISPKYIKR